MAASTKNTGPAPSDADDLLKSMGGTASSEDDFADADDLLNQVEEDDSEGWVPKEKGEGIAGRVIRVGETRSDFAADGENPMVPTVTIETGDGTKWRIIGYSSVLKRELKDQDPQVGDLMAVKYFGEKALKTGKFAGRPYKHFGIVVRRPASA